jgi:rod shape determining protein RodA
MFAGRIWRDFNFFLLGCILVLLSISVLSVYSATLNAVSAQGNPFSVLFPRHVINIVIGLVAMGVVSFVDYRLLSGLALPFYLVALVSLSIVLLLGNISGGAQSWLELGTRTFQPSELAKLLVIIVLASYWARFEERSSHWLMQLGGLVLAGVPLLLVFVQPDFGTSLVFVVIWLSMAWGAGIRWHHLLVLALLAVPVVLIGWHYVLDPEQKSRLLTFYWLLTDPAVINANRLYADEAYNIIQALNAIGAGGLFGAGLTHGLLSQGNYIPVQYSDFIFAVIGEEMGFAGGVVVLVFQTLLLWIVLSIAQDARDMFGRLIALGVFGMLLSHVAINVGMTISVLPVTGLPLPFISYGGSFTLTTLIAMGLLESIRIHRHRIVF